MTTLSKYQVSWLVIPESRKHTSMAGLYRINKQIEGYKGYSGFSRMENAYIRHFPNKEAAQAIQSITGGIIISDAQFGQHDPNGNLRLSANHVVRATKKQLLNG